MRSIDRSITALEEIVRKFTEDSELSKFLPEEKADESDGWSKEAEEFLSAISLAIVDKIIEDDAFLEFDKKYNYYKDD